MSNKPGPRRIVAVGGGIAGWMSAAVLVRALAREYGEVRLIEGSAPAGVARAVGTLPSFRKLCGLLEIDARELMQATNATFTLGAQFRDWGLTGEEYFHGFGPCGARLDGVSFHQCWLRLQRLGQVPAFEEYSPVAALARAGRFALPASERQSPFYWYSYGYHLDARLLTDYLRRYALQRGLRLERGSVVDVEQDAGSGLIKSLRLDDGRAIEADLVIDCTAERSGPLWRALGAQFEDWRRWMPCDRALSIHGAAPAQIPPYSCFTAAEQGWRWQIPLQDAVDSGYAYCPDFSTEAQLDAALRIAFPGASLAQATALRFNCGRPDRFWSGNLLLLGACNAGPLESTGLHLLQSGITRLLALFPNFSADFDRASAQEYNRLTLAEHDAIRDFLALHFTATGRDDSPFWKYCRAAEMPASLRERIELFRHSGRLGLAEDDCFGEEGWLAVLLGQHIVPDRLDPLAEGADPEHIRGACQMLSARIRTGLQGMP
ncbi:MAG TPA: tryptophan halogenase family protein, partial [Steroidobacteraceae bacterium]